MNPNQAAQIRLNEAERKQRDAEQQLRDAVQRGDVRYDEHGEMKCMCVSDGYVMARRKGAAPFLKSVREWNAMRKCRTIDEVAGQQPGTFAAFVKERNSDPNAP